MATTSVADNTTSFKYFRIRTLWKYQQQLDRTPPWIKLYSSVLSDLEIRALPIEQRHALIMLWVLACSNRNKLRADVKILTDMIGVEPDIDRLLADGFIEPWTPESERCDSSETAEQKPLDLPAENAPKTPDYDRSGGEISNAISNPEKTQHYPRLIAQIPVSNEYSNDPREEKRREKRKDIISSTNVEEGENSDEPNCSPRCHDGTKNQETESVNAGAKKAHYVPIQKIVELYHEHCPELPRVRKLTKTRIGHIRQRWIDGELPRLEVWERYFRYIAESDFLCGRVEGSNGRPPFQADLEWLCKPGNYAKVAEARYHRTPKGRAA